MEHKNQHKSPTPDKEAKKPRESSDQKTFTHPEHPHTDIKGTLETKIKSKSPAPRSKKKVKNSESEIILKDEARLYKTGFDLERKSSYDYTHEEDDRDDEPYSPSHANRRESKHRKTTLEQYKELGIEARFEEWNKIFLNNKKWAQEKIDKDPNYFLRLVDVQKPDYLWIGCSDSRVPANEIVGLEPGEIFVHRNIANLIISSDLNLLSVVEFAVSILKVKHIIVCGHYGCSGVKYASHSTDAGMLNPWITSIKDHYRHHRHELDDIKDEKSRINKFVEYNVIEGCLTLMKFCSIQKSFAENRYPIVHACVYDLSNGRLIDLDIDFIERMDKLGSIYSYNFAKK